MLKEWPKILFVIVFFVAGICLIGKGCVAGFEWAEAEAHTDQNSIRIDDRARAWLAEDPDRWTKAVREIAPVSPEFAKRTAR
ncbi:MAG: hypothetical protein ABII13_05895 [Patescibacteria group bacterium]|nr:hypothetical protein [Patescibacteria group bacterium]MBU2509029.1 hypothetical protein [Patescibacteria group bacterium]